MQDSEIETLTQPSVRTVYVSAGVTTKTTTAKVILGIANVGNGLIFGLYVSVVLVLLAGGIPESTGEARSNMVGGSIMLLIWSGIWLFIGLKGWCAINQLRQECLTAILNQK